jgi:PhnB protein
MASAAAKKAAATRKRRVAASKAATTRKRRAAGRNAAATRKRRAAATSSPSVIPMLSYEDGIAALQWLTKAFEFRERQRLTTPDGRLSHGEMEAGDGVIMLASPTPDYQSPKRHRQVCEQARKWSAVPWIIDGVLVFVDDLDAHFAQAKAAGATILSGIEDGPPGRRYRAEDLEGHRWFFFAKDEG